MKPTISFLFAGALLLAAYLTIGSSVGAGQRAAATNSYAVSTVVTLPYGDSDNVVGFVPGGPDMLSAGPQSFAVSGGDVFILDTVNAKLKRFDHTGTLRASIATSGYDIGLEGGRVLVAESDRLASFDTDLRPLTSIKRLQADESSLGSEDFDQMAASTGAPAPASAPTCTLLNNHEAEISVKGTRNPIRFVTPKDLGSAVCLGQDRNRNVFIATEFLATVDGVLRVTKQVQKLAPDGRLLATIAIPIDYAAFPQRELMVDANGVIYQMRPLADRLLIQAWRPISTGGGK